MPLKNESERNQEREEERGEERATEEGERGRVLKFRMGWRKKEREQGNKQAKQANTIAKG